MFNAEFNGVVLNLVTFEFQIDDDVFFLLEDKMENSKRIFLHLSGKMRYQSTAHTMYNINIWLFTMHAHCSTPFFLLLMILFKFWFWNSIYHKTISSNSWSLLYYLRRVLQRYKLLFLRNTRSKLTIGLKFKITWRI